MTELITDSQQLNPSTMRMIRLLTGLECERNEVVMYFKPKGNSFSWGS